MKGLGIPTEVRDKLFTIIFTVCSLAATAQDVPDTEIFLLDLKRNDLKRPDLGYTVGTPVNITNRPGYDNQPYFLPGNKKLLFTSIQDGRQADIYEYNIAKNKITQITHTSESEYSPTLTPEGKYFSVVRVEADDSTQRIWKFPLKGGDPSLVLEDNPKVGYYAWLNKDRLAMFVLGEKFTLQTAGLVSGERRIVAENIGRAVQKIPGSEAISFVSKADSTQWMINRMAPDLTITPIVATLPGNEDYAWHSPTMIIMGSEGKLYYHDITKPEKGWMLLADLSETEVKNFYRIAVSPDGTRIALVAYKGEKP